MQNILLQCHNSTLRVLFRIDDIGNTRYRACSSSKVGYAEVGGGEEEGGNNCTVGGIYCAFAVKKKQL